MSKIGTAAVIVAAVLALGVYADVRYRDHLKRCAGGHHELIDGESVCVDAGPRLFNRSLTRP